jgi:hypothetical protein
MDEGFVAYLDILGFSELVRVNDHSKLVQLYGLLISATEATISRGVRVITCGKDRIAVPNVDQASVNLRIVSDSVIVFSQQPNMRGCIDVLCATRTLLWQGLCTGLPMRGAIAFGSLTSVDREIGDQLGIGTHSLVGKALVDAYTAEADQDWSGATLTQGAKGAYEALCERQANTSDLATLGYLVDAGLLIDYDVPMTRRAGGRTQAASAVNWPRASTSRPEEAALRSAFEMHGKNVELAGRKVQNTLDFLAATWPNE